MYRTRNLSELSWSRRKSSVKESDFFALSLRVASIRKHRPYDDLHSADAPIVWQRLSTGYRIIDLHLDKFMLALHFVLVHRCPKYSSLRINRTCFCQSEPTFKAVGLHEDAVSMKSFMTRLFNQMEHMMSFCAVQEGSNDLVGVLITSIFNKPRGNVLKEQGETLRQTMMLRNYVITKSKFYKTIDARTLVSIDVLCVKAEHQKNGIGTALLQSCVTRASSFATACIGQFTSGAAQTIAARSQFKMLYELPYERLKLEKSRFEVFESCHPENYSTACMAVDLTPPRLQLPSPIASEPIPIETPTIRRKKGRKKI